MTEPRGWHLHTKRTQKGYMRHVGGSSHRLQPARDPPAGRASCARKEALSHPAVSSPVNGTRIRGCACQGARQILLKYYLASTTAREGT